MSYTENEVLAKIKVLYKQKGWTVYRLAKESDMPYSSLNNIMLRNTQPTIPTLRKICNGLGISLSEFFADDIPTVNLQYRLQLKEDEFCLVEAYRDLKIDDKNLLFAYMQGLSKKNIRSNEQID